MQILTKKRFCFRNGEEKVETAGGGAIETVPDWVAKTRLFDLAVSDGNIIELAVKSRKVAEKPTKAKAAE